MIADAQEVLKAKALPPALWSQAVRHAVWIKNRTLTQSLNSKITPYQSYFGKAPSLATLHLFGCKAYAHIPKVDQTKLGEHSIECVHIGFAEEKRAYILYSCERQCLIKSRDVKFEEVENEGRERITTDLDTSDEDPDMDNEINHDSTLEDSGGGQKSTLNPQGNDLPAPELSSPSLTIPTSIPPRRSNRLNKGIPPPQPDKDLKLSLGSRPKTTETGPIPSQGAPSVGTNNSPVDNTDHMALFLTTDALHSYQDAMAHSDADGWVEAIMEEYSNLQRKDIFVEVEVPPDKHVHEGRPVFSEKIRSDGEVVKKKVRLVTKGYTEIWGGDYWNTYSPTLGCDSLLSLLAYAKAQDLEIHQMDDVSAYLNSNPTEEIYISLPKGIPICSGKVWQLKKALYGLKQAGLEWYCTLRSHIKSVRYVQSGYDPCLYVRDSDHFTVVYVDNLLVFGTKQRIAKEKKELAGNFEMRDLGEARWFLVMEITRDRVARTITIDQRQYIQKILERFGLENSQSVSTPMAVNIKLPKLETPEVDQRLYQSMLGSLMYAAIGTRPNIMFAVHYLSRFSVAPSLEHIMALKHIYRYLNGTRDLRMTFHGNQIRDDIIRFMDLDWARDANSWRLVSGYTFIFCGAAIAWSAKKHLTIALLSMEAEYMALTHAS